MCLSQQKDLKLKIPISYPNFSPPKSKPVTFPTFKGKIYMIILSYRVNPPQKKCFLHLHPSPPQSFYCTVFVLPSLSLSCILTYIIFACLIVGSITFVRALAQETMEDVEKVTEQEYWACAQFKLSI